MKERNTVKSLFSREQMNDYSGCLYYNTSGGGGVNTTVGSDVGVSLNAGWYLTSKPQLIDIPTVLGGEEVNAGLEVQGGIPTCHGCTRLQLSGRYQPSDACR
jgi:hypothetical protein